MASVDRTLHYNLHADADAEALWGLFVDLGDRLRVTTRGSDSPLGFPKTVWTKDQRLDVMTSARTFKESRAELVELGADVTYSFYTLDARTGVRASVFGYLDHRRLMVSVTATSLVTLEGLCAEVARFMEPHLPKPVPAPVPEPVPAPVPEPVPVPEPERSRFRDWIRRQSRAVLAGMATLVSVVVSGVITGVIVLVVQYNVFE